MFTDINQGPQLCARRVGRTINWVSEAISRYANRLAFDGSKQNMKYGNAFRHEQNRGMRYVTVCLLQMDDPKLFPRLTLIAVGEVAAKGVIEKEITYYSSTNPWPGSS